MLKMSKTCMRQAWLLGAFLYILVYILAPLICLPLSTGCCLTTTHTNFVFCFFSMYSIANVIPSQGMLFSKCKLDFFWIHYIIFYYTVHFNQNLLLILRKSSSTLFPYPLIISPVKFGTQFLLIGGEFTWWVYWINCGTLVTG